MYIQLSSAMHRALLEHNMGFIMKERGVVEVKARRVSFISSAEI